MHQSITSYDFRRAFETSDRRNQFSYEALGLLFDYFEQYEEDTGEPLEFDMIAICCEYVELSADDVIQQYGLEIDLDTGEQYGIELDPDLDTDEQIEEYLSERTAYVGRTDHGSFVFAQF